MPRNQGAIGDAPAVIYSPRFLLRQPNADDAPAIFASYANHVAVCRYVGWPRHLSVRDTEAFLAFSEAEWSRWPAGPYLIVDLADERIIGSTGLAFVDRGTASTGYVVVQNRWRQGIASEALRTMRELAGSLNVKRLFAVCHPVHQASRGVLEKAGFRLEPERCTTVFPNLDGGVTVAAVCYACDPREASAV